MIINNAVLTGSFTVNGVNYITNTPTTGSNTYVGTQTTSGSAIITGSLQVTGSVSTTGTITAQTLVVQTVTSSIVYSSGSNIFGNSQSNVQQMTGSLRVTGSSIISGQIKTSFPGQSISVDGGSIASVRMQLQNTSGNAGVTVESSTGGDQFTGTSAYSMAIGTYTAKDFHIGTNSVSRMTISSAGAATFSSTISAGAATFSGKVIGTGFYSYSGTTSIASAATSTIYTMGENGLYTVSIIVTGGSLIYSAAAIFYAHAQNAQYVKCTDLYDGANVTLDNSGGAIRITNNGFATLTWTWSVLFQGY